MKNHRGSIRPATSSALMALAAVAVVGCGGGDDAPGETATLAPQAACSSLVGKTFQNVNIIAAVDVAASGAIPAYCKVSGTEAGTEHDIEVRLPTAWHRRFVQQGGGGFDGSIPNVSNRGTNVALSSGAMQAANNGGHRSPSGGAFAGNPLVVQRYAHTAIITTTLFSKAVAATYYGEAPRYSYYEGCSNGGRGALNAAAKYGSEFDGIIAGAPTRNLPGQIETWTRQSILTMPSDAKLAAVSGAAIEKCDALDGAADGIVSNWKACSFDPTTDVPASVGLTPAEAASVKSLMQDLKLAGGETIYSGYGLGTISSGTALGVGHMRNIVLNDPGWDPGTFNVETYYPTITNVINGQYQFSASEAGLAQFLRANKKVMIWHGSTDGMLSHNDTIRTWKQVTDATGDAIAQANSRLYVPAGVNHCGGGAGADRFDLLTPLIAWVEQGKTPETPVARRVDAAGATVFSRPMCVHPQFAKYKGTGDVASADNWICSND